MGFIYIVVSRIPASWAVPLIPKDVACGGVRGTLWSGVCSGLVVDGQSYGDVQWTLHPWALMAAQLSAHLVVTLGPTAQVRGDLQASPFNFSDLTLRNLAANLPLDRSLIPQLPSTLSGTAHLDLDLLRLSNAFIKRIEGRIEVDDVVDRSSGGTRLGSYVLTFPPGGSGDPTGELHDVGSNGPLAVQATLRLTQPPGYNIQGQVTPRPTAPEDLVQTLKYLGTPDAQGRRSFGLEGRF